MKSKQEIRNPQRVRNVSAFVKSLLARRTDHAITTNQIRYAFARAVGVKA